MYGEHTGMKCKIPINQDFLSDEEELDEEDDPVQLFTNDTELNEQEKKEIFKDEAEMPPWRSPKLGWDGKYASRYRKYCVAYQNQRLKYERKP